MILERFDDFFIEGRPYLDKVVMRIITDPAARAIAYENGEVHMGAFESLPRIINRLKKVDTLTVTDEGYGGIGPLDWLAMNTTKGPWPMLMCARPSPMRWIKISSIRP